MGILNRFSLQGQTALVTGAGRGIGYALAQALAEAGADVACFDIVGKSATIAAARLASLGVRTLGAAIDVSKKAEVGRMVKVVLDAWGALDIAVNNAGIDRGGMAEELSEGAWDAVVDVDLKGVFLCCQAEAQAMLARGRGSVINVASMSGSIINRPLQHVNYDAAKAGVIHLTRSCAAEWAGRGVRVNCLSPGNTLTPMTEDSPEEMRALWRSDTPMGRLGTPADMQGAVVYLASEVSSYVTGHNLIIDGGYVLW